MLNFSHFINLCGAVMGQVTKDDQGTHEFTTKELWFYSIFISVIQAFIWYVCFVNANNGSALTYVSFAGTLISIVLALIAIGYTYGDSIYQKLQGHNFSSQISSLNRSIEKTKLQSESLDKIHEISESLIRYNAKVDEHMSQSRKNLDELSNKLYSNPGTTTGKGASLDLNVDTLNTSPSLFAKQLASSMSIATAISILLLFYYRIPNKLEFANSARSDLSELLKKLNLDEEYTNHLISILSGALFTTLDLLIAQNLIFRDESDSVYLIQKEFRESFISELDEYDMPEVSGYSSVFRHFHSRIKDEKKP